MASIVTVTLNPAIDRLYSIKELTPGTLHRVSRPTVAAGGKGLNVARAGEVLGDEYINIVAVAGKDGDNWLQLAVKEGLRIEAIIVAGNTRTCVKIAESNRARLTELNEAGSQISTAGARDILEAVSFISNSVRADVIAICGSAGGAGSTSVVTETAMLAQSRGIRLAIDTSGEMLKAGIQCNPWLVKINRVELAEWMGVSVANDEEFRELVCHASKTTGGYVCVTDGANGSVLANSSNCWSIGAPRPKSFKGTVGSGDAYFAGIMSGLLRDTDDPERAMWMAAACGSANVENAIPGKIDLERVRKLMNSVRAVDV